MGRLTAHAFPLFLALAADAVAERDAGSRHAFASGQGLAAVHLLHMAAVVLTIASGSPLTPPNRRSLGNCAASLRSGDSARRARSCGPLASLLDSPNSSLVALVTYNRSSVKSGCEPPARPLWSCSRCGSCCAAPARPFAALQRRPPTISPAPPRSRWRTANATTPKDGDGARRRGSGGRRRAGAARRRTAGKYKDAQTRLEPIVARDQARRRGARAGAPLSDDRP